MNRLYSRLGAYALTSALCLVTAGRLSAQTAAAPAAGKSADEETIVLSPFVVEPNEDQGYSAKDTLAGTRVRTELKDVASAISVVTQQFLKDTGAKNSADLLVYTPSTEVAGIRGNFSGVAGTGIYQENTISSTTRVRGLDSADNTRDYFLSDIPWDGFNVGRVDLQRGPNSILFGIGSPAGIINTSVNDASFKTAYNVENRIDQYGSFRNQLSLNQELIKGVLAIRIAGVKDDEKYEQKPAFNNSTRWYGALRFDPKLFGEDNHTSFRVKYETGKVDSNNPRSIPPGDNYSMWFKTGTDAYGNPAYNKVIINAFNTANPSPGGGTLPGGIGGTLTNGLALANAVRSYWPDVVNFYEGTNKNINNIPNAAYPSGTPIKTIVAQPQTDLGVRDANGNTLGGVNASFLARAIPQMSSYANGAGATSGFPGFSGTSGVSSIPGGVYYANVVMTDPTIFDFYKKLLDGPNKKEWQKWSAFNFIAEQSFFNDRLAFQVAYDHQSYTNGNFGWMSGENYNINIDINATYADGTANPNVGRPYAGNGASAPGLNNETTTVREGIRFTPTADIRASDFLGDTTLAKILGRHVFTGVYERSTVVKNYKNFAEFATTPQYMLDNRRNDATHIPVTGQLAQDRSFEWLVYLGPSLLNKSTGSGANLTNIQYVVAPPASQTATNFNARWNKPTTPGAPGYVDPTAPYTYTNYQTGATINGTQVDNTANYVGWTSENINWMRYTNPAEQASLNESANRTRFRDTSQGFTWQGYLLGGDLVPTFGWRKDIITNYQTSAQTDPITGFTSLDFVDDPKSRSDVRGESKTWGIVYHLPKSLTKNLPWGSTVSFFYDRGVNFKADASRLDLAGRPIPNANGTTKEYGITITTLNDKLSLKFAKYSTKVANATLADTQGNSIGGLGSNAYFIADGNIWGYGWATYLQDALRGTNGATLSTYGDFAGSSGYDRNTPANAVAYDNFNTNGGTGLSDGRKYAGGLAVVNAWVNAVFPSTFFSSYNLTPAIDPTIAKRTGNLRDSYTTGYNDASGPQLGGGSSFGNHQTTVDNLSSGTEIELSYQPTKNWNITANYAKTQAKHENIDPTSIAFIGALTKFMNGPGGQLRMWYNGGGDLGADWNGSIVAPYAVTVNELGHQVPELSPWRLNLVSTYNFDHGTLKGVFVGGAFREEAGRIIGYKFDPNFKNSISTDPNFSDVVSLTLGGLNVTQPFVGPNDHHIDAWVGYSRKLTRTVNWRIQVNVRNVGEKDKLIASRFNPDGSLALASISQGMGWQLTNSFDF